MTSDTSEVDEKMILGGNGILNESDYIEYFVKHMPPYYKLNLKVDLYITGSYKKGQYLQIFQSESKSIFKWEIDNDKGDDILNSNWVKHVDIDLENNNNTYVAITIVQKQGDVIQESTKNNKNVLFALADMNDQYGWGIANLKITLCSEPIVKVIGAQGSLEEPSRAEGSLQGLQRVEEKPKQAPVVEASKVQEEVPTEEKPVVEASKAKEVSKEEPLVEEEHVVETPVVEAPVVEVPAVEAPTVEAPTVEAPKPQQTPIEESEEDEQCEYALDHHRTYGNGTSGVVGDGVTNRIVQLELSTSSPPKCYYYNKYTQKFEHQGCIIIFDECYFKGRSERVCKNKKYSDEQIFKIQEAKSIYFPENNLGTLSLYQDDNFEGKRRTFVKSVSCVFQNFLSVKYQQERLNIKRLRKQQ